MKNLRKCFAGFLFITALMSLSVFGGCGSADTAPEIKEKAPVVESTAPDAGGEGYAEEDKSGKPSPGENKSEQPSASANDETDIKDNPAATEKIPQKIIKTAEVSCQVAKYEESRKKILSVIAAHKGYVSSEDQSTNGYNLNNTMVIRVDAPEFDVLLDELLKEAVYVEYKKINASDVTEEFVDINARLKSKRDAEEQYTQILKKANTINEILEVQQYLRTIREEIESLEGRLRYLNDKVSYSTITLSFYEKISDVPVEPGSTFLSRLTDALSWGWHGLLAFFIGIIYVWPLWVILAISLYIVIRIVKRSRRRRMQKQAAK